MSAPTPDPDVLSAWAASLQATLKDGSRRDDLRQRLLARVADSARAHADYRTVRREASAWQDLDGGVRLRSLRCDDAERVDLVELSDGAALPATAEGVAVEWLITQGSLVDGLAQRAAPTWSHAVWGAGPQPAAWQARGPTTLYRRLLRQPPQRLPAAESRWWRARLAAADDALVPTGGWRLPGRWVDSRAGVQVLPLAVHGHVVSMLVRFEAGAGVPDHGHEIGEDCLVLEGEMFLGDILLRAGDYQLAPAGGGHFGETSDVGVLFFFHGALDEALRSPARP